MNSKRRKLKWLEHAIRTQKRVPEKIFRMKKKSGKAQTEIHGNEENDL
jgi:hypothetical protein